MEEKRKQVHQLPERAFQPDLAKSSTSVKIAFKNLSDGPLGGEDRPRHEVLFETAQFIAEKKERRRREQSTERKRCARQGLLETPHV